MEGALPAAVRLAGSLSALNAGFFRSHFTAPTWGAISSFLSFIFYLLVIGSPCMGECKNYILTQLPQYHYEMEVTGSCLSLLNNIKQQLGYCTVKHIQNNINKMISNNI